MKTSIAVSKFIRKSQRIRISLSVVFLITCICTANVYATWSNDPRVNNAICTAAPSNQWNPQIVTDGSGGAIIAWSDGSYGHTYTSYAQRVNVNGDVQWTTRGVAI